MGRMARAFGQENCLYVSIAKRSIRKKAYLPYEDENNILFLLSDRARGTMLSTDAKAKPMFIRDCPSRDARPMFLCFSFSFTTSWIGSFFITGFFVFILLPHTFPFYSSSLN